MLVRGSNFSMEGSTVEATCIGKKLGNKGYLRLDEDPATQKLEDSLSVKTDGQVHPNFIGTSLRFSFGMHFFFYIYIYI